MPIEIRESQHSGIWEVLHSGPTDLGTRLFAFETGKGIIQSGIVSGILVDFRQAELTVCKAEVYDLSRARVSSAVFLGIRTALLFKEIPEEEEFDIVVAQNRGLDFRAFTDEGEAMAWLAGGKHRLAERGPCR